MAKEGDTLEKGYTGMTVTECGSEENDINLANYRVQ